MLRTISIRLGRATRSLELLKQQHVALARYGNASGSSRGSSERSNGNFDRNVQNRPPRSRDRDAPRASGFGIRRPETDRDSGRDHRNDSPRSRYEGDMTRRSQAAPRADAASQTSKPPSPLLWNRQALPRTEESSRNPAPARDFRPAPPSEPSRLFTSRETLDIINADSYTALSDAAESSASASAKIVPAPQDGQKVIADLDDFFAGHADAVVAAPSKTDLPQPIQRRQAPPAPSSGIKPLASYTPPRESGVEIVKRLMLEHKYLTTKQIWRMATDGLKPIIQPDHVIEPNGRIRMKRVSTMREGRRPWVPPTEASFPEHPFRSVRFLKETLLASLENTGVIHKRQLTRPLETEAEHKAAIWKAESINRKAERRAVLKDHPTPAMRAPATSTAVWAWLLGPSPEKVQVQDTEEVDYPEDHDPVAEDETPDPEDMRDLPPHAAEAQAALVPKRKLKPKMRFPPPHSIEEARTMTNYEVDDAKWEWAARQEFEYHKAKLYEAQATAERQTVRRQRYREEREELRRQAIEDAEKGVDVDLRKEQRRLKAIEDIEAYGQQTGEDVSGWFDEIGRGPLGEVGHYAPRHQQRGGAVPRGKNARKDFKPVGFPIN